MLVNILYYSSAKFVTYRIAGFFSRPNFCEVSISLPRNNICDYYIYESIHSSRDCVKIVFLYSVTPEVESLSYL